MKTPEIFYSLYCLVILPVFCNHYLPLLRKLDMKNPLIIGESGDLRNQNMFYLMKDIMKVSVIMAVEFHSESGDTYT